MANSTAILVLGMHRSGTSAATGWLQALGVNLGPYLMAGDPSQPKGYFEHREIVAIHEELLREFNSSWDDPRALPEGWESDRRLKFFRARLVQVISRDLAVQPLWGVKDPRLCRLLPLWLSALDELDIPVRAILVLRHPAEVADSLAKRNGFLPDKSGMLWLRYMLEAERYSRSFARITLRYEDLLCDWRSQSERIARTLGLAWPTSCDEVTSEAGEFLETSLRHHVNPHFDAFPIPLRRWIVLAYRALRRGSSPGERETPVLDSVRRELMPYDSYVAACWLERTRDLSLINRELRFNLSQREGELSRAGAEAVSANEHAKQISEELTRTLSALEGANDELAKTRSEMETVRSELAGKVDAVSAELLRTNEELAGVRSLSNKLSEELGQARSQLTDTQTELAQALANFARSRSEIGRIQSELNQIQSELSRTQSELSWTQPELSRTKSELGRSQSELSQTQSELNRTQSELSQTSTELMQVRAEAEQRTFELRTLYRSRSWRLTKPLRVIRNLVGAAPLNLKQTREAEDKFRQKRANLSPYRGRRTRQIWRMLRRGDYHRFAHGFDSAFRDYRKPRVPSHTRE